MQTCAQPRENRIEIAYAGRLSETRRKTPIDSSKTLGAVANQFEIEIGRIDKSNLRGLAAQWCGNDLNLEIG
jgi:hypothetical protein